MQSDFLYIYTVYQEASFSKAAEKLYLTQPALSIAIQKIETSIGMPLFDRSKRPLQLTAAGKAYIDAIEKMQYLEQDLNQEISDIRNLKKGTLRIGGSHYINAFILAPILAGFNREYPEIHLELVEAGSAEINEMLAARKLDMTFSCNDMFMKNFEKYAGFRDRVLLAVPQLYDINQGYAKERMTAADILEGRHLREDCPRISLEEFRDLDYIFLKKGNNLYDRCIQLFAEKGIRPRIKMSLSQMATAKELAEEGMAATFVCDRLVRSQFSRLYYYKLDSKLAERIFYIILPNRAYTSHAAKMFIQYFLVNLTV